MLKYPPIGLKTLSIHPGISSGLGDLGSQRHLPASAKREDVLLKRSWPYTELINMHEASLYKGRVSLPLHSDFILEYNNHVWTW